MNTKLNILNTECEEKYKDFDEHVVTYLEQKYGDSEAAIEKGEVYLEAITKYSKGDTRALLFWKAWNIPYIDKSIKYSCLTKLRTEKLDYVVLNQFLRLVRNIIQKEKDLNPESSLTVLSFFTEDVKIDCKIWHNCLKGTDFHK